MASLEELKAERERRIASKKGGATQKGANGGGSTPAKAYTGQDFLEAIKLAKQGDQSTADRMVKKAARAAEQAGLVDDYASAQGLARRVLDGMTLGAADAVGSAVATGMALPGAVSEDRRQDPDKSIWDSIKTVAPDIYKDIRGTVQYEEDEFREEFPDLAGAAEVGGALASGGALAARALPKAAGGLMRRGAAGVRAGAQRAAGAVRGGSSAAGTAGRAAGKKPYFKMSAEGPVAMNKSAAKILKKAARKEGRRKGAAIGGAFDAVEYVREGDVVPGNAAAGAIAGGLFPKAAKNLAFNSQIGRWAGAQLVGKHLGPKARAMYYTGMHPSSRRAMQGVKDTIVGGGK